MATATARHRALADARRARIVDELERAQDGLDAVELARLLGLHANTVRWHLGILADADIVGSRPAARTTPGRPRILYSLEPAPKEPSADEHRLLATVLTGALAGAADGSERAEDAGRAWGRYLMARDPLARTSDDDAVGEVVELLDGQGFDPEARGHEIHMHRCPFTRSPSRSPRSSARSTRG